MSKPKARIMTARSPQFLFILPDPSMTTGTCNDSHTNFYRELSISPQSNLEPGWGRGVLSWTNPVNSFDPGTNGHTH